VEKHTTQRPTGENKKIKKSLFRQEWFKCGMGWFTWNEDFSFSAFGTSDGNCFGLPHALVIHCGGTTLVWVLYVHLVSRRVLSL
jgi:hypothetical protein